MTPEIWGLTAAAVGVTALAVGWVLKTPNKRGTGNSMPMVSRESGRPVMGKDGRIAGVIFKRGGLKRE